METLSTNYNVDKYNNDKSDFSIAFKKFRNGPEGSKLTHRQAREVFHKMYGLKEDYSPNKPIMLGTLQPQQKENTMYGQTKTIPSNIGPINMAVNIPKAPQTSEDRSKDHLLQRVETARYEKLNALRKAYGTINDDEPNTMKDFFDRIAAGKYILDLTPEQQANRSFWNTRDIVDYITWRDPAVKQDHEGLKAASGALQKAVNDVSDEIIVKTPAEGLQSLRDFQAKTFN
jgi:hypothetical protein